MVSLDLQVSQARGVRRESLVLLGFLCLVPQDVQELLVYRVHKGNLDLQAFPVEDKIASLASLDVPVRREREGTLEKQARKVRRIYKHCYSAPPYGQTSTGVKDLMLFQVRRVTPVWTALVAPVASQDPQDLQDRLDSQVTLLNFATILDAKQRNNQYDLMHVRLGDTCPDSFALHHQEVLAAPVPKEKEGSQDHLGLLAHLWVIVRLLLPWRSSKKWPAKSTPLVSLFLGWPWTSRCSRIPWRERRPWWCHHSQWCKRREGWHWFPWTSWSSRFGWSPWSWWSTWSFRA